MLAMGNQALELLVAAAAILVATKPAGWLIGLILQAIRYKRIDDIEPGQDQDTPAAASTGLPSAGMWIGCLERIAIVSFVLIGDYQPIGFLLAAKSILRFPEISKEPGNSRALAEYVIIGTMLSLVVGLAIGWAGRFATAMIAGR